MADHPRYNYDPNTGRFTDTVAGRQVDPREIRRAGDQLIDAQTQEARALAQELIDGKINLIEWQIDMHALLHDLHVALGLIAGGGLENMTAGDVGYLGAHLRDQYRYLRDMVLQIERGQQPLNGLLLTRAGLFTQASRGTYEEMMRRQAKDGDMGEERRVLGEADHCPTCLEQADLSWQPLGVLHRIGESECLSNCRCSFEFRGRAVGEETGIEESPLVP